MTVARFGLEMELSDFFPASGFFGGVGSSFANSAQTKPTTVETIANPTPIAPKTCNLSSLPISMDSCKALLKSDSGDSVGAFTSVTTPSIWLNGIQSVKPSWNAKSVGCMEPTAKHSLTLCSEYGPPRCPSLLIKISTAMRFGFFRTSE